MGCHSNQWLQRPRKPKTGWMVLAASIAKLIELGTKYSDATTGTAITDQQGPERQQQGFGNARPNAPVYQASENRRSGNRRGGRGGHHGAASRRRRDERRQRESR
jgi:hypothetical protein